MKVARPEKITTGLADVLAGAAGDERTLPVYVRTRPGSANTAVGGRYVLALNGRAGETVLGSEVDGFSGYLSRAEVEALTFEVWVEDLQLIS
jgi:hypothetical protein